MSLLGLAKFRKPARHQILSLAGHLALGAAAMGLACGIWMPNTWLRMLDQALAVGVGYGVLREIVQLVRTRSLNLLDRLRDALETGAGAVACGAVILWIAG